MASGGWKQTAHPDGYVELWSHNMGDQPLPVPYWHPCGLTALVAREEWVPGDWRWHISVRYGDPGHNGRVPTWEELVRAAHELRPGVVFVIGIPPRSWWMSVHPHVLHLMETKDEPMIEQFKANSQHGAAVPS